MEKNEIIKQIRDLLQRKDLFKVMLFGSYANGTQKSESDIDLLVVTNDDFIPESFSQKMKIKLKVAAALNPLRKSADIDLIVHTRPMFEKFIRLNSSFYREILHSGIVIYERNNA